MPTLHLEAVTKQYKWENRRQIAIQDMNLQIDQGEFVFVIGSSGAGKSTLLGLLSGEIRPDQGTVYLDGADLRWSPGQRRAAFGRVWQEPKLPRKYTIGESLAAEARRGRRVPWENVNPRIVKVLGLVGLPDCAGKYPVELSIGELRRAELARALVNSPPILILDELTANQKDGTIWDMLHLLNELNQHGTTIIMATHASQYVNIMRRRVITLVDGTLAGDVKKGRYGDIK